VGFENNFSFGLEGRFVQGAAHKNRPRNCLNVIAALYERERRCFGKEIEQQCCGGREGTRSSRFFEWSDFLALFERRLPVNRAKVREKEIKERRNPSAERMK
jgi:hypothetical protein